jgi:two-component system phosphate regulon sensor histidine kinase PhoR
MPEPSLMKDPMPAADAVLSGIDLPGGRRWDDRVTFLALGRLEMAEPAAVFGLIACLALFSLALAAQVIYGVAVIYAFPIALSAWFFGRWVGGAMGAFAVVGYIVVAISTNQRLDAAAVVMPALVLVTAVSVAGSEWARRSESLVRLLNQRELRHRQLLETMTKVGQELVASKRWEVIADHMMASLVRDLELDAAWMFVRDVSGMESRLLLLATAGDAPAMATLQSGEGSPGRVLRTGKVILARSRAELLAAEPGLKPTLLEAEMEAVLALPVTVKSATAGVVMLGARRARVWRKDEVGIAAALVNQLGLAMENASAYRSTIEALVRLEEISQLKSDLLKTVSHELRTPMTVLAGYMDMMRDGSLGNVPAEWEKPLEQVGAKVAELNRLVQMMLDASRAEGPTMQVNLEEVDIGAAVAMAVSAQEDEAQRLHRSLRLEVPRQEVRGRADRDKILVVLRNLIENAIKYSPEDSTIDIGLSAGPDVVRVWVADRGTGIPDDDKARVFEQFHRIERPETRNVGGTGLGLFIVKQLVEVQGGQIVVEDRPGGGSIFTFAIPRRAVVLPGTHQVAALDAEDGVLHTSY